MSELAILKQPLTSNYQTVCYMPEGSKILCIKLQYNKPTLWFLCDTAKPNKKRIFVLESTGAVIDSEKYRYIGTVLTSNDSFVSHCFELISD